MNDSPTTHPSLLARLGATRDDRAWAEFVAIYDPLVRRLARRKGFQDADASDLAQEVFRSVALAIERGDYDPARGSFRGWLFRIARNAMINTLAAQKRHLKGTGDTAVNELLEAQPAPAEAELIEAEYRRSLLHWAAEQVRGEFSAETWAAFWKTGVEGRRAKAAADALGMTPGAVYRCKSRVMARIREKIEEVEGRSAPGRGESPE